MEEEEEEEKKEEQENKQPNIENIINLYFVESQ